MSIIITPIFLFYVTVCYNFRSLFVVRIVDDSWGTRGDQKKFSVKSHTHAIHIYFYVIVLENLPVKCEIMTSQILSILPKLVMS